MVFGVDMCFLLRFDVWLGDVWENVLLFRFCDMLCEIVDFVGDVGGVLGFLCLVR